MKPLERTDRYSNIYSNTQQQIKHKDIISQNQSNNYFLKNHTEQSTQDSNPYSQAINVDLAVMLKLKKG